MAATSTAVERLSNGGSGGGSRWCPTPEQVMLLEGMYRGGLKTPTAAQIQQITARLSLYGKIQGKNVFYWFQNHKARDRQKIRKKLMAMYQQQQQRLLPSYNSSYYYPFPLQGGGGGVVDDMSSCKSMTNEWNVEERCKKVKCDCSLMTVMMMDQGTSQYCTRVPPKTLQLFPTAPASP